MTLLICFFSKISDEVLGLSKRILFDELSSYLWLSYANVESFRYAANLLPTLKKEGEILWAVIRKSHENLLSPFEIFET